MAPPRPPSLAPLRWQVTQAQIAAYAEVSGANDPLHLDPAFGRGQGFGGTIAQGLLVFGTLSEFVIGRLPDPRCWIHGGRLEARFRRPVRPGDTLVAQAVLVGEGAGEPTVRTEYRVWCENDHREVVVVGRALVPGAEPRSIS